MNGDPLHPFGRCTCGGEGQCRWCRLTDEPDTTKPVEWPPFTVGEHDGELVQLAIVTKLSELHSRLHGLLTRPCPRCGEPPTWQDNWASSETTSIVTSYVLCVCGWTEEVGGAVRSFETGTVEEVWLGKRDRDVSPEVEKA